MSSTRTWILFDIDATLMDHEGAFRAGTAALHGHSVAHTDLADFTARWSAAHERNFDRFLAGELTHEEQRRARVRDTFGESVTDAEAEQLFGVYVGAYENAWALFDDVLHCLDALGGYRLGVISNGQSVQQRAKLARLGIADRFAHVTVSQDCGAAKPDSRIFRHVCERCGIEPAAAVYVGDRYDVDAEGARRAGLTGIWLDRARTASLGHVGPVIHSLVELPPLVEKLSRR
jgi:putative hydrolase of the HAD superfamily